MQQCLPFTVLKRIVTEWCLVLWLYVATVLTVYGIETPKQNPKDFAQLYVATVLIFTVGAAECEAAKEQSDNEAYTLQAFEQSEGKTKVIKE